MNKKQLYILAWGFLLIGMIFIYIDATSCGVPYHFMNEGPLTIADVYCAINSEMYEPFINLSYLLWILFMVLAWQTKEKK